MCRGSEFRKSGNIPSPGSLPFFSSSINRLFAAETYPITMIQRLVYRIPQELGQNSLPFSASIKISSGLKSLHYSTKSRASISTYNGGNRDGNGTPGKGLVLVCNGNFSEKFCTFGQRIICAMGLVSYYVGLVRLTDIASETKIVSADIMTTSLTVL